MVSEIQSQKQIKKGTLFKKWAIYDMTLIAMFVSLTLLMDYITNFFPKMPFGGTIGLKYLPLILISYLRGFITGIFSGVIVGIITVIIIPNNTVVNLWQYILDYFIPVLSPSIVALFSINATKKISLISKSSLSLTLIFVIIYVVHVVSGVLYFEQYSWSGYTVWTYSLIYNSGFIGVTYLIFLIVVPLLYKVLHLWKEKYYFMNDKNKGEK